MHKVGSQSRILLRENTLLLQEPLVGGAVVCGVGVVVGLVLLWVVEAVVAVWAEKALTSSAHTHIVSTAIGSS